MDGDLSSGLRYPPFEQLGPGLYKDLFCCFSDRQERYSFSSACTGSISNSSAICYVISKFFQRKNIFSLFAFECDFFRHFLRVYKFPFVENLTSCQKHQRRAREFSRTGPNSWNFIPRCREDGGYYEVQCHVSSGQCWCVDQNGNELWGSVTRGLPDCSGK